MSDDTEARAFAAVAQHLTNNIANCERRLTGMEEAIAGITARLDRLEAAVVIQTGTVFGAQGDSARMAIEHTIPEPPLNEWKA